ncbi:hypothetical protein BLA24_25980 [Streptomyces cinnamoneus]|uniref:Uncharacterized protein n=1 Tax=Streptomyces cinnamoneus TaxID=53446 RepID=A0A2G1XE32_STRCJ|nr:hypothetical protein BLA24_25980 [Streptomyces cinnamoneus]PPT14861.1 hypothetical protein CYQ11_20085 [Streptomyces cinnamoneus]
MTGEGRSVTVTIKCGAAQEDPQLSFRGPSAEVQEDIAACFGFDRKSVSGLTLHELVAEANQLAQGASTVMRGFPGARVVPQGDERNESAQSTTPPAGHQETENPLLEQITACATTDDLRRLWATNQHAFTDPAVMDAWKARGRALAGS